MRSCAANSQSHTPRRIRNYFKTTRQLFTVRLVPLSWKQKSFLGYHFFSDSFFLKLFEKERENVCVRERKNERDERGGRLAFVASDRRCKTVKALCCGTMKFHYKKRGKKEISLPLFFSSFTPIFLPPPRALRATYYHRHFMGKKIYASSNQIRIRWTYSVWFGDIGCVRNI